MAPENTMDAFRLALRLGATGLESDAWLTADGHVVLDHDGVVGRWPRRTPMARLRREELPPHVPTLAELYEELAPDAQLSLDVRDPHVAPAVLAVVRAAGDGAEERLWLCNGDLEVLSQWRRLTSAARLVHSSTLRALPGGPEVHAARLADLDVDALNLHHTQWTGGRIALLHRFGRFAFGWDCQHDHVLDELLDSGIDAIYSDHVDRMADALARLR